MDSLILRGTTYHYRRRVPKRYRSVEPREVINTSLGTDSLTVARSKGPMFWAEKIKGWEARLAGDTDDAEQRFAAAQELAQARGFRYLPMHKVLELPFADLEKRLSAIPIRDGRPDLMEARALLGAAPKPSITVTAALKLYWSLTKDLIQKKSLDQLRCWKNPRIKAIKNFVDVVGDKPISEIDRDDMLDFRDWWIERIEYKGLTANSGNKDITHFSDVIRTVNEMKRLGLSLPLGGLTIKTGDAIPHPPFSDAWISDRLLAPAALDGLNAQARAILLTMINTGARPSEIANLTAKHIVLDSDIPHISIEADDRELKSRNARRKIPLVGCSLEAMRANPEGFPRYRDTSNLSATVNKFLWENGLKETDKHVLYSLRHSYEDRLRRAKIDERIRTQLFGHSYTREKYGEPSMAELLEAVQDAAL